jgi:hypothetical protein
MSQAQLDAFQAAVVALEVARNKAAKLRKEVGYAENRAKRAEEEAAKLNAQVEAMKKPAAPAAPKQLEAKKA